MKSHEGSGGFALFGAVLFMAVLLVLSPALIKWLQEEAGWAAKEQKSLSAYNLAEAGIDRGQWMLKSSTSTWAAVLAGSVPGYDFDVSHADVGGGEYRIRLSSGPERGQVTILSQARDAKRRETRAIRAVYRNAAIPGPLMSRGDIALREDTHVHWGAVNSQRNIILQDAATAGRFYPRKIARLVVSSLAGTPRDENGLQLPNTGNGGEWWSNYNVPNLPRLDFETMRSSAAANRTLNCYGRFGAYPPSDLAAARDHTLWYGDTDVDPLRVHPLTNRRWRLATDADDYATAAYPFGEIPCQDDYGCGADEVGCASLPTGSSRTVEGFFFDPRADDGLIWYWDGVPGPGGTTDTVYETGVRGTFIFRGNMEVGGDDMDLVPETGGRIPVPPEAWREYAFFDTAAPDEYPGDLGFHQSTGTYQLETAGGVFDAGRDLGLTGFLFVGGDFTLKQSPEVFGAVWVEGDMNALTAGDINAIFYDSRLEVPVLDVVLSNVSWVEVPPSDLPDWP